MTLPARKHERAPDITNVMNAEQLEAMVDGIASDLPGMVFTGLGHRLQLELKEHGRVSPDRLEQLRGEVDARAEDVADLMAFVETDAQGRITGAMGLTGNPTVHEFRVDGRQLYTWCAFDALAFAVAHDWAAEVRSRCPATGRPIELTATPDGVTAQDPRETVLALAVPDPENMPSGTQQVQAAYCAHNNLYVSEQTALQATGHRAGVVITALADAHRLAQRLVAAVEPPGDADRTPEQR